MNYGQLKKKPLGEWRQEELERVLLTPDGIGLKIKKQALEEWKERARKDLPCV